MPGIRFSVKGMSMGYICYYCIETEIVQNLRSALFWMTGVRAVVAKGEMFRVCFMQLIKVYILSRTSRCRSSDDFPRWAFQPYPAG